MSDIDLVKKVRVYAEEAEKNGFEVLTVPLRDLFPLLGRMEAAERERDELRGRLTLVREQRDAELNKNTQLEAEIARRDAAAGVPVAVISEDSLAELKESFRPVLVFRPDHKRNSYGVTLYTAAQPAVLPPKYADELTERAELIEAYSKTQCEIAQELGCDSDNESILKAIYELKELGAQQQKVVELPTPFNVDINLTRACGDIEYQYHEFGEQFDRDDVLAALEAAGVKWEVKK